MLYEVITVLLYAAHNTFNYLIKSQYQAYHDALTTLGNRRYFIELLNDAMKSQKQSHRHIYLILIDLDHFKTINDTLGHDIGDVLLRQAADRIRITSYNVCYTKLLRCRWTRCRDRP